MRPSAMITALIRPIAHRMSFIDTEIAYRNHCDDHYRFTAFDIGE